MQKENIEGQQSILRYVSERGKMPTRDFEKSVGIEELEAQKEKRKEITETEEN